MEFSDVGLKVTFVEEKESNSNYTARALQLTDLAVSSLFWYKHYKPIYKALINSEPQMRANTIKNCVYSETV